MMRTMMTNAERQKICQYKAEHPHISQTGLASWAQQEFNLPHPPAQTSIGKILSKSDMYREMSEVKLSGKRNRVVQHPELDKELANWLIECRDKNEIVTSGRIKEKGRDLAEKLGIEHDQMPAFSNGWLGKFQLRHGFKKRKITSQKCVLKDKSTQTDISELKSTDASSGTGPVCASGEYMAAIEKVISLLDGYVPKHVETLAVLRNVYIEIQDSEIKQSPVGV